MSRIKSSSVKLGDSFVVGCKPKQEGLQDDKEDESIIIARKQAEEIVNNANNQVEKMLEDAKVQIQAAIQQAQEEGYQVGHKAGYEDGYNQIYTDLTEQMKAVDLIAESAFNVKKEIVQSSEQEMLELTLVIAERVMRQCMEINPEIVLNIIKAAINELSDKEEIKIAVNPALTKLIYDFSEELKQTIKGLKSVKIVEDKTVPPDGAIVESLDTRIDARLVTQIAEISKQLISEAAKNPVLSEIPKEIEVKIEEPPKKTRGRKNA